MQFKVPQFIDVEDKIFGPFTFKEFIYMVGGAGMSYILYRLLPIFFAIILIIPTMSLALALAFYKINGKPFIFTLEASIKYIFQNKLYIWKKQKGQIEKREVVEDKKEEDVYNPRLSRSKLKDIAWSLDILESKKEK